MARNTCTEDRAQKPQSIDSLPTTSNRRAMWWSLWLVTVFFAVSFIASIAFDIPIHAPFVQASRHSLSSNLVNDKIKEKMTNTATSKTTPSEEINNDSSEPWWSGMRLDHDAPLDGKAAGVDGLHVDKRPLVQIPCGVLLSPPASSTASDESSSQQQTQSKPRNVPLNTMIDTSRTTSAITRQGLETLKSQQLRHKEYQQTGWDIRQDSNTGRWYLTVPSEAGIQLRMMDSTVAIHQLEVLNGDGDESNGDHSNNEVVYNVDGTRMDLLLGVDFLERTGATLNFEHGEMEISGTDEASIVPFIRPRLALFTENDGGDL